MDEQEKHIFANTIINKCNKNMNLRLSEQNKSIETLTTRIYNLEQLVIKLSKTKSEK